MKRVVADAWLDKQRAGRRLAEDWRPIGPEGDLVLICLLGQFRVLKRGQPVGIPSGGKAEMLLRTLVLRPAVSASREWLLEALWPTSPVGQARQSLNSLVYSLHRLLGDALGGAAPVLHRASVYRLNLEAGIRVDVAWFDALADAGNRCDRARNLPEVARYYRQAAALYLGDLDAGSDVESVIERERLRSRYLALLVRLADLHYDEGAFTAALEHALLLLGRDPCREDAHRMAMRCYLRTGQRAQALRQYRLCEEVLSAEFGAAPEAATKALFEQIRLTPSEV